MNTNTVLDVIITTVYSSYRKNYVESELPTIQNTVTEIRGLFVTLYCPLVLIYTTTTTSVSYDYYYFI